MNKNIIGGVVAIVLLLGAGFFILGDNDTEPSTSTTDNQSTNEAEQLEDSNNEVVEPEVKEDDHSDDDDHAHDEDGNDIPFIAMTEVATHNSATDCWTYIEGSVYDISDYVQSGLHPGGVVISETCGTEGTSLFRGAQANSTGEFHLHSVNAENLLKDFLQGKLK